MEEVSMNFSGQNYRSKLLAILIGLVLIFSGIIASTVVIGAGRNAARAFMSNEKWIGI